MNIPYAPVAVVGVVLLVGMWAFTSCRSGDTKKPEPAATTTPQPVAPQMVRLVTVEATQSAPSVLPHRLRNVHEFDSCDAPDRNLAVLDTEGEQVVCKPVSLTVGDNPPLRWQR